MLEQDENESVNEHSTDRNEHSTDRNPEKEHVPQNGGGTGVKRVRFDSSAGAARSSIATTQQDKSEEMITF